MRLEYTSLIARRQTLPSAVGCSVMSVSQVRRGGGGERGPGALPGTQARGLVLPGADAAGGQLIGDEPVPERDQHLPRDAASEKKPRPRGSVIATVIWSREAVAGGRPAGLLIDSQRNSSR